jgi:hypothetical protein
MRATYPAHLILFDLITRKIFSQEYRSLSSSLCTRTFIHSPVTSSHLGPAFEQDQDGTGLKPFHPGPARKLSTNLYDI